jgi:predicted enzyme related to lactoylglutathione lyase
MIRGIHNLIYSEDPGADRAFLRDVLGFPYIDAHDGWLIFALPPTEMGIHPPFEGRTVQIFLMCDELSATVDELRAKGATFRGDVMDDPGVGRFIDIELPSGTTIGLYEPMHATPLPDWPTSRAAAGGTR